jgi:hypothetical protein
MNGEDCVTGEIPEGAMKYLKYLPTIAKWIKTDKQISKVEMRLFKFLFSEPYRLLKTETYEQIEEVITPYRNDPQFGKYVCIALSSKGEAWLKYAIKLIHES